VRTAWPSRRELALRLAALDARIAATPDATHLQFIRACLLEAIGRRDEARLAYLEIAQRVPTHFGAINNLGTLLYGRGLRRAARRAYEIVVARHPRDVVGHANLAQLLVEMGELRKAYRAYEAVLAIDPENATAHHGLASVFERLGDPEAAQKHRSIGFRNRPVTFVPYRGDRKPVRLLALGTAEEGNVAMQMFRDDMLFEMHALVAETFDVTSELPPHDVVFNTIGDVERCAAALDAADAILARTNAPVINPPSVVRDTGRVANAARFALVPGVLTATTVAFAREHILAPDAAQKLAAHGFSWPLLLRSPGYHTGQHFIKVDGPDDLTTAVRDLPGEELLAIAYLDTRSADGLTRKYRVMIVDGVLYPVHVAISKNWKVHYFTADMSEDASHRTEDDAFLRDMAGVLGPRVMAALDAIREQLGLDYGGIDFSIDASGNVVIFEANATMIALLPEGDTRWAYRRAPITRLHRAIRDMLVARATVPHGIAASDDAGWTWT
jgi:hypothetical protein